MRISALLLLSTLLGCGGARTTLSMQDVGCASCADSAMEALAKTPGVSDVSFRRPEAELVVDYDPEKASPKELAKVAAAAAHLKVVVGAGKGSYEAGPEWPEGADMKVLRGPTAELLPVPGKVTVFDFYADWCKPCRVVDATLRELVKTRPGLAVRKVDIGDWGSPLANKHLAGVDTLPYVRVYAADGTLVEEIAGLDPPRLRGAIETAEKR